MRKNSAIETALAAIASPPPAPVLGEKDFGRVRGQESVKRAIVIALAGPHSTCFIGPPGHGKTMMIEAAKAIDLSFQAKEITILSTPDQQEREQMNKRLYALAQLTEIHIEVPAVPWREITSKRPGTDSAYIRRQIERAREFRANHPDLGFDLSEGCLLLAKQAYEELGLTPRSHTMAVGVARTIADLEESEHIQEQHLAEAVQYRLLDRRC